MGSQLTESLRRRALAVCDGPTSAADLLPVARALHETGRWRVCVVVLDPRINVDHLDGIEVETAYEVPDAPPVRSDRRSVSGSLARLLPAGIREGVRTLVDTAIARKWLLRRYRTARSVLDRFRPDVVLVAGDRGVGPQVAFIRGAREIGAKSVVVPFAATHPETIAFERRGNPFHLVDRAPNRFLKKLLVGRLPAQVRLSNYGRMFYLPPATTIALYMTQMLSPNPWALGGGRADRVAVSDERERDQLLKLGVLSSKLAVTGQPSLDELYATHLNAASTRNSLRAKYGLADRPIVCCAVPHWAEHGMIPWPLHDSSIEELFSILGGSDADVLLSLHPKSDLRNYEQVAKPYGLTIAAEPLRALLPAADLFLAGFSSTVKWGILLGIPTVIDDPHCFRDPLFADLEGPLIVEDRARLSEALSSILYDPVKRKEVLLALQRSATRLGPLDGAATRRVVSLIEEL